MTGILLLIASAISASELRVGHMIGLCFLFILAFGLVIAVAIGSKIPLWLYELSALAYSIAITANWWCSCRRTAPKEISRTCISRRSSSAQ